MVTEGGGWSHRSSYPDRTEGGDGGGDEGGDEELPDQKTLEYDEDTLELTLPSGKLVPWDIWASEDAAEDQRAPPLRNVLPCVCRSDHLSDINTACSCVSGAKIGHRSLMRYYKQRFGAERAVVLSHSRNAVGRVLRQYRALGWAGEGESCSYTCFLGDLSGINLRL